MNNCLEAERNFSNLSIIKKIINHDRRKVNLSLYSLSRKYYKSHCHMKKHSMSTQAKKYKK